MADIFDWSATAANNVTVDGININTGMSPGNVDNAKRSTMAIIRNTFVSGWQGLFAGTTSGIPVSNGSGTITAVAAPTGTIVGTTDAQTLTNKTISGLAVDLAVADGGTGASTAAGAFANIAVAASSLAANGYIKFQNGLMLQWGSTSTFAGEGAQTVNFPTAFPTACFTCVCSLKGTSSTANDMWANMVSVSASSFTAIYQAGSGGNNGSGLFWIAVGN